MKLILFSMVSPAGWLATAHRIERVTIAGAQVQVDVAHLSNSYSLLRIASARYAVPTAELDWAAAHGDVEAAVLAWLIDAAHPFAGGRIGDMDPDAVAREEMTARLDAARTKLMDDAAARADALRQRILDGSAADLSQIDVDGSLALAPEPTNQEQPS